MKKDENVLWGIKALREHFQELDKKQATKTHQDLTAYFAQNDRNKSDDAMAAFKIIKNYTNKKDDFKDNIVKYNSIANGYIANSSIWQFGENILAPALYIISFIFILADALLFIDPSYNSYVYIGSPTIVLIAIIIWYAIDKTIKKYHNTNQHRKQNRNNTCSKLELFVEKSILFNYVSARYSGSLTLVLYFLYYVIKKALLP